MEINKRVDHLILWQINEGNTSFWWDNWTDLGQLAQFGEVSTSNKIHVSSFMTNREWNMAKLAQILPAGIVQHIQGVKINSLVLHDYPIWTLSEDEKFNCSSAWNHLRSRKNTTLVNNLMWHNKIPSKFLFSYGNYSNTRSMWMII